LRGSLVDKCLGFLCRGFEYLTHVLGQFRP
jgi:hypothetical protein